MTLIEGYLEPFCETGTEGTLWAVIENGKESYEALNIIREGDFLEIYDREDKIIFSGYIKEDRVKGYETYPHNPGYGQPVALGMWIHWTQQGYEPNDWASLFFTTPPYRAILKTSVDKKN